MQKIYIGLLIVFLTSFTIMPGCSDEELFAPVSEQDIAELISESLSSASGGLYAQIYDGVLEAFGITEQGCGAYSDTTFNFSISGPLRTFNYELDYSFELFCYVPFFPSTIEFAFTQNGALYGPVLDMESQVDCEIAFSEILTFYPNFILDGYYHRQGNVVSNVLNENTLFTSDLEINLTELTISKIDGTILGGNATFDVGGANGSGLQFSFDGGIEFLGNDDAIVSIGPFAFPISLTS